VLILIFIIDKIIGKDELVKNIKNSSFKIFERENKYLIDADIKHYNELILLSKKFKLNMEENMHWKSNQ